MKAPEKTEASFSAVFQKEKKEAVSKQQAKASKQIHMKHNRNSLMGKTVKPVLSLFFWKN